MKGDGGGKGYIYIEQDMTLWAKFKHTKPYASNPFNFQPLNPILSVFFFFLVIFLQLNFKTFTIKVLIFNYLTLEIVNIWFGVNIRMLSSVRVRDWMTSNP